VPQKQQSKRAINLFAVPTTPAAIITEEAVIKEADLLPKKKIKTVLKKKLTKPVAQEEFVYNDNFMDTISQKIDAYTGALQGSDTIHSSCRRSQTPLNNDFMEFRNDTSEGDFYRSSRKQVS
jgi:hypothetical protein